jgi:hypothetical protein
MASSPNNPGSALPFTYADIVLDDDMSLYAAETTSDLQTLVQDVTHVLVELLGSNPDDPNRGVGIATYLSGKVSDFQSVIGIIERQLTTDDRITSCVTTIVPLDDVNYQLFINIEVAGAVIPLQFGWSSAGGLVASGSGGPWSTTVIPPDPPPPPVPTPYIWWGLEDLTLGFTNLGAGPAVTLGPIWNVGNLTPHVSGPSPAFALDYDGASGGAGMATSGGSVVVPPGNSFSYSLWVFLRAAVGSPGSPVLLTHAYGASWPTGGKYGNGIVMPSAFSGDWQAGFYLSGGGTVVNDMVSFPIPTGAWTHIAVTFDGTTLTSYLNGTAVVTATAAGAPRSVDFGGGNWGAGGNPVLSSTDFINGRLSNAQIYDVVLTPTQVLYLFNNP